MLSWIWNWRLQNPDTTAGRAFWLGWSLFGALLVLLAPLQFWDGRSFWNAPAAGASQALLAAAAFLGLTSFIGVTATRPTGIRAIAALAGGAAWYVAAFGFLDYGRTDMAQWGTDFAVAALVGVALAFFPLVVPHSYRAIGLAALAGVVAIVAVIGLRPNALAVVPRHIQNTELRTIAVSQYASLIDPPTMNRGGAIEAYGESFVLITGDGTFYRLDWNGDTLVSRKLPLALTLDRARFIADQERLATGTAFDLRTTGLLLDTKAVPAKVYVSHQYWDAAKRCFSLRVSMNTLDESARPSTTYPDTWKTVFQSQPCLPLAANFQILESGGKMAWFQGKILLTSGINGLGHPDEPASAQSPANSYGKVILLDGSGGYEVFTTGHRNPQGLLVADDGRLWLTEHGPRGGDEINLLEAGRNYGYPFATYGTEYGQYFWPLAPTARNHGNYTEPAHVFTPSVGIASVIQVHDGQFPEWQSDLLIGSLMNQGLLRVRVRDDRVIYVEQIGLGERIRDLAEGADGRIVLFADSGALLTLATAPGNPEGSVVYGRCEACHGPTEGVMLAPSLRGIVGATVAAERGYQYSPALRQLGGVWTEDRLDAFLANPNGYAPGSVMEPGRVFDAEERRVLIEFLKSHK